MESNFIDEVSPVTVSQGVEYLLQKDKSLATIIHRIGPCQLKLNKVIEPYEALAKAIAGQQLHGKAVQAILARLEHLNNGQFPSAIKLIHYTKEQLRACGFSERKAYALQQLAKATLEGIIPDLHAAKHMSDEALITLLTQLPGVGRWTVEMFLIFTLGRLDIMPIDDFGVREGWRIYKKLPVQPKPKELCLQTEKWSPYRSIGAWYLWRVVDAGKPVDKQNPMTL